jgi:hypothetical protein
MSERFVHTIVRFEWPADASPETEAAFREGLPRNAARRMTKLGLLCARVLRVLPTATPTALVYASSMSEARTLEAYLDSFPDASPTRFQGSIHPAGAQQALIALERPTREFYPLAGGDELFAQALDTALLAEAEEVVLLGGEEAGGWLTEIGLAGDRSFAFGLVLSRSAEGACAAVRRSREEAEGKSENLAAVHDRLGGPEGWSFPSYGGGSWRWQWL